MFPTDVHPQGVRRWSVEAAVVAGEALGDLVLGLDVPPHVGELAGVVLTVVLAVVQPVLPTLVLP